MYETVVMAWDYTYYKGVLHAPRASKGARNTDGIEKIVGSETRNCETEVGLIRSAVDLDFRLCLLNIQLRLLHISAGCDHI
jgi:hypothetical protein